MNAPPPAVFQAILERPNVGRRLIGSAVWIVVLHAAAVALLVSYSGGDSSPPRKPRRELTVTLLDAAKIARLRSLGAIGGGTAGDVGGGLTGKVAPRATDGQTPHPAVQGKAKARDREKSLPQDQPRALVGVTVQNEPTAATPPSAGSQRDAHSKVPGSPNSALERGAAAKAAVLPTGTGGAGVVGSGVGSGSGGSSAGTGAGARPGIASGDTEVLPFKDGMTRPTLLSKTDPIYTREARDANVAGLILTKCVITTSGTLRGCRIVRGIPLMDQAVLSALAQWRYSPVLYQGKPVTVEYLIPVRLVRP